MLRKLDDIDTSASDLSMSPSQSGRIFIIANGLGKRGKSSSTKAKIEDIMTVKSKPSTST